jgi:hypothetical protein
LNALPRWIGQLTDLDIPEHWLTPQRILEDEARVKRVPMMAPEPPDFFVPRPVEFDGLKGRLLDAKGDAVGITAALRGAGGYGKTTLARALAHDPDIQDAHDGVSGGWAKGRPSCDTVITTSWRCSRRLAADHTVEAARSSPRR